MRPDRYRGEQQRWQCRPRSRSTSSRSSRTVERDRAAQLWVDGDWIFANKTGAPLNPNTDYDEWKRLLALAGLRDGRLHDARHTAATVLLILGVPERAVMDLMGWSSSSMARRYQHVTAQIRLDIARRVGGLLWDVAQPSDGRDEVAVDRQA